MIAHEIKKNGATPELYISLRWQKKIKILQLSLDTSKYNVGMFFLIHLNYIGWALICCHFFALLHSWWVSIDVKSSIYSKKTLIHLIYVCIYMYNSDVIEWKTKLDWVMISIFRATNVSAKIWLTVSVIYWKQ